MNGWYGFFEGEIGTCDWHQQALHFLAQPTLCGIVDCFGILLMADQGFLLSHKAKKAEMGKVS